jgi:hypothetical protein
MATAALRDVMIQRGIIPNAIVFEEQDALAAPVNPVGGVPNDGPNLNANVQGGGNGREGSLNNLAQGENRWCALV